MQAAVVGSESAEDTHTPFLKFIMEAKMTRREAMKILSRYNKWRRGGTGPMPDPTEIGLAIDVAIHTLRVRHGIIIDGVLHGAVKSEGYQCSGCSLFSKCNAEYCGCACVLCGVSPNDHFEQQE